MSFEFTDTGVMRMLMVRNYTGVMVKYDATMTVDTPGGERELHTSMCPVFPGALGNEQWMDKIISLKLSNFRKLDGTGNLVCN